MKHLKKINEEFFPGKAVTDLDSKIEVESVNGAAVNFLGEVHNIPAYDNGDMSTGYQQLTSIFKKYLKNPEFVKYLDSLK